MSFFCVISCRVDFPIPVKLEGFLKLYCVIYCPWSEQAQSRAKCPVIIQTHSHLGIRSFALGHSCIHWQPTHQTSTYDVGTVPAHQGLVRLPDMSPCKYTGTITKTIHGICDRVQTCQTIGVDWGIQKPVWSEILSSAISQGFLAKSSESQSHSQQEQLPKHNSENNTGTFVHPRHAWSSHKKQCAKKNTLQWY